MFALLIGISFIVISRLKFLKFVNISISTHVFCLVTISTIQHVPIYSSILLALFSLSLYRLCFLELLLNPTQRKCVPWWCTNVTFEYIWPHCALFVSHTTKSTVILINYIELECMCTYVLNMWCSSFVVVHFRNSQIDR